MVYCLTSGTGLEQERSMRRVKNPKMVFMAFNIKGLFDWVTVIMRN
jgi:hypothetical protein